MTLRIVFMGTPDFSVPALKAILDGGHEVVAVYTRAPKPAGRGMAPRLSPVHQIAESAHIPVLTPKSLRNDEAVALFRSHHADVAVVVAYGLILPKPILDAPVHGCVNLHASLLPRWRGAAPIQRAIMAGDAGTGVMAMQMDEGLDTGGVGMEERLAIGPDMTAGDLHDALSATGAGLVARALAAIERGEFRPRPQPSDGVTYASKIDKAECRIDWTRPAREVHNHIRGLSPFPGAFFEADLGRGPERIKALRSTCVEGRGAPGALLDDALTIACGEGAVRLTQVQRAGKGPMSADDFLRGARLSRGPALA